MTDLRTSETEPHSTPMSPKLRAALDYLGDKLATHRASRFKPAKHYLLDEWLVKRRATASLPGVGTGVRLLA